MTMMTKYQLSKIGELIGTTSNGTTLGSGVTTDEVEVCITLIVYTVTQEDYQPPAYWKGLLLSDQEWICVSKLPSRVFRRK